MQPGLSLRRGAQVGIAFSLIHIIIGGIVMGIVPKMHPMVPEQMSAPGYFMSKLGVIDMIAFVILHMIYGVIMGSLYTLAKMPASSRMQETPGVQKTLGN